MKAGLAALALVRTGRYGIIRRDLPVTLLPAHKAVAERFCTRLHPESP